VLEGKLAEVPLVVKLKKMPPPRSGRRRAVSADPQSLQSLGLPMSSRWVPLMQGSMPEVITLQTSSEASGILTFVPDMNTAAGRAVHPRRERLRASALRPRDRRRRARSFRRRKRPDRRRRRRAERDRHPPGRVRWCCVLLITAPVGVWLGLRYLLAMLDQQQPGSTLGPWRILDLGQREMVAVVYVCRIRHGH
jgi:hypothetical protein